MSRLIYFIVFLCMLPALTASPQSRSRSGSLKGAKTATKGVAKTPAKDSDRSGSDSVSKPRRKGSAWIITTPLGDRQKSTIDTLQYNYQRKSIPSLTSDAYATTGTLGSAGINMIFLDRAATTTFFFDDALSAILPSLKTFKFYNVYTPMTLLSYNFGGNKQNHADRLNAVFAGNVNRNIGIGAFLDYNYCKGAYKDQALKDLSFGASFYFNSHRYEAQAIYWHFTNLNKDNGGITDDLYITDPAQVQGGIDKIEPKSIPTNLSTAQTRMRGQRAFMTHAFKLGYWSEEQVNDTLTRDVYIPVTKFIYSLDYQDRYHRFTNIDTDEAHKFWENHYLDPTKTNDNTHYWSLVNTVGVQLLEGFRKWAKFGISAYASLETRRMTQTNYERIEPSEEIAATLTPLPEGFKIDPRLLQNRLSVGGSISKTKGDLIKYSANARFGLVGGVAGDIDLSGKVSSRFRMLGDTVDISAYGGFSNKSNSYFLNHYISNHFAWDNKFGKTRQYNVGGRLVIPWTRTVISAGLRNLQNYVFFNTEALPEQYSGNVQVFALSLDQKLRFGIWNWNNTVTWQVSSNQDVIPLPALSVYSNMYLDFRAFKVLNLQIGVDCDYYTHYYGYAYQPATMAFHIQHETKVGNYPFCNAYISAKLYKCRFYVLWSHFNQGWFGGRNYFSLPHYPLNPRCLQFGLCVDFAN